MAKQRASGTPATAALSTARVTFTEHAYAHDPAAASYGLEAAQALDVEPGCVFKTLLVDTGSTLAVGIVPVDRSLDLKALAAVLGTKRVSMADPAAAVRSTGYVLGGISPIGQKRRLTTVLDLSAQIYGKIYISGGRRGFDIGLAPSDLISVTGATLGRIAR